MLKYEDIAKLIAKARAAGILREAGFEYRDTSKSNIADWLESTIHKSFTMEADDLLGAGHVSRDERIMLSGLIGDALGVFSAGMDAMLPELRAKPIVQQTHESYAEQRDLSDVWTRDITEATIDAQGNLSGIVLVEGESKNGNVYTLGALESGPAIFSGKAIYADHPSRTEATDRPERSVRDLVGKLPESPDDLWVAPIAEGPHAGKNALFYRNGVLSETADWLATLIREGIAGAQSINALGGGDYNPQGKFQVEAFLDAKSLDFVTSASAGGVGQLQEADRDDTTQTINEDKIIADFLEAMTLKDFATLRPDIVDGIAHRERAKVYGEKSSLLKEATMSKALTDQVRRLRESVAAVTQQARRQRASELTASLLAASPLPPMAHKQVRRVLEGDVRRFIEQEEPMEVEAEVTTAIVSSPDLAPSDPPTIEVPAEVPEDKKAAYAIAYIEATEKGVEPQQATNLAWAAIIDMGGGEDEIPDDVGGAMVDTFTEAQLAEVITKAIAEQAVYLSEATGAGGITGLGAMNAQALQEQEQHQVSEAEEIASWRAVDPTLTDEQARTAIKGRGRAL